MGRECNPLKIMQEVKFGHTNKWYMHNTESVLENKTQRILSNFRIQTDHLILTRPSHDKKKLPPQPPPQQKTG